MTILVSQSSKSAKPLDRINGFDYLRAIFSMLVVFWHTNALNSITFSDRIHLVIYYSFALLAVPVFFQISLFLFHLKWESKKNYLKYRLKKLTTLYIVWVSIWILFSYANRDINFLTIIIQGNWEETLFLIISGAYSVSFFFFSLIALTIASHFYQFFTVLKLKQIEVEKVTYGFLTISGALMVGIPILTLNTEGTSFLRYPLLMEYWSPINFIPYIFTSFLIANEFKQKKVTFKDPKFKLKIAFLGFCFLVATVTEYHYLYDPEMWRYLLPPYNRVSLVFGSSLILYLSLLPQPSVPQIIKCLSDLSLGIFCIHSYVSYSFLFNTSALSHSVIKFLLVLGLTISLVTVLKKVSLIKHIV
ncbi:MAG: acyltransferase [Oculatellaceae cyanobacterium bins.114]|nr:acyltransferase [Oculatellaceae cyanobacterium bins.114]